MSSQTGDQTNNDMLYEVANNIATITFNRPEQQNTISRDMLSRFTELLIESDADEAVRAIVVTGTGKFFCAGLDLRGSDITDGLSDRKRRVSPTLDLRNTPPTVLHNIDTPTIAALNGSAAGYGMDMALGCDIRIMADTAKLAAAFTARGIVAGIGRHLDLAAAHRLGEGQRNYFTGKTLTAVECEEMGLVSHVVNNNEVGDQARELAKRVAAQAPMAVQASKRMMRMGMNENFDDHVHHVFLQLLPLFSI